jgi:hypothetical protein
MQRRRDAASILAGLRLRAATTGHGTPFSRMSLVDYLNMYVSPGDAVAVLANTKPKPHPKPIIRGSVDPH